MFSKTRAVPVFGAHVGIGERFRGSEIAQRRLSEESESPQGDSRVTSQGQDRAPGWFASNPWVDPLGAAREDGPYRLYPAWMK